jgi:hypothetical protein
MRIIACLLLMTSVCRAAELADTDIVPGTELNKRTLVRFVNEAIEKGYWIAVVEIKDGKSVSVNIGPDVTRYVIGDKTRILHAGKDPAYGIKVGKYMRLSKPRKDWVLWIGSSFGYSEAAEKIVADVLKERFPK